jgi:hypothetical protein
MKIKEMFYSHFDELSIDEIPEEYWFERYRNWRTKELKETDWTQLPDAPVNSSSWVLYRQELRDLPTKPNFAEVELPTRPA